MIELRKLIIRLRGTIPSIIGSFPVSSIPLVKRHKLGINKLGYPIFFLHCNVPSQTKGLNYDLEMIRVSFGTQCKLDLGNGVSHNEQYVVMELKEGYLELEDYFLDIVYIMLKNLPEELSTATLRKEIDRMINLFNKVSQPPLKSIQGLWAELLIIERSISPSYLVRSWHIQKEGRFDFNDGVDKIEVKSTAKNIRVHSFSSQQLNPNLNTKLLIASVMVIQTGVGTGISELANRIEARLDDLADSLKLREIIAATLGEDIKLSGSFFFDYQYSVDSLSFYDCSVIPNIPAHLVPQEISNIYFDVNLSQVENIDPKTISSALANSL